MKKPPPKPPIGRESRRPQRASTSREDFWQKVPEVSRYDALMRALRNGIPGAGLFSGGVGQLEDPIKYVRNWEA
jgi:hypothetical protein